MNKTLFGMTGATSMHPATVALLAVAIVLVFTLPRKYVIAPILLLSLVAPMGQVLMLGTFHLQVARILAFVGWIRLIAQKGKDGSASKMTFTAIDKAVIAYVVSSVVCYTLLWQASAAFFSSMGTAYTALSMYFLFRSFIRDQEDIEQTIKVLVAAASIIGLLMLNEQLTGKNVLSMFGGVPANAATRAGYLRSQGPFQVYLTAGAFGATLLPLFLTMWRRGGKRVLSTIAIAAALSITVTSRTSTASSAALAAAIGIGLWRYRDYMRVVRWGVSCAIVSLHMVMRAPVWSLIQRVDLVGGSDGWHRFKIVDNFIKHFFDWALLGARNYMRWEGGDDMWDLANQYVAIGEATGLITLILFLTIIVYCFKYLGRARIAAGNDTQRAWFLWLLGVTLFSNMVAFMGISYFDQTLIYWYLLLAIVVAAATEAPRSEIEAVERPQKSHQEMDDRELLEQWAVPEAASRA